MIMSPVRARRFPAGDVLAAAALTIFALTALSAASRAELPATVAAAVDSGGDKGLPPSPGPTDPNGP